MPLFRKKPVVIEAVQWTGKNFDGVRAFCPVASLSSSVQVVTIPTLEGQMDALPGSWIIRGVHGEFYPCKPDIFEKTYEAI